MILVTGSAGFIGFHLARRLTSMGHRVVGLDNLNNYYEPSLKYDRNAILQKIDLYSFEFVDIKEVGAVFQVFERYRPSHVVHLAAQAGVRYSLVDPHTYIESNIVGFLNVLEACRKFQPQHFVFASSSSVYGSTSDVPFTETDCADRPASLYAATKRADELLAYSYCHNFGIPTTGLRFFTVYGPWGRPDMAYFRFTKALVENDEIELYNNGRVKRDFTYVDDVVECMVRVIFQPPSSGNLEPPYRIYNVGNRNPVEIGVLVEILESLIGKRARKKYTELPRTDPPVTCADTCRLERDFGFSPNTPLEQGLKRFVDWYLHYYRVGQSTVE